MDEYKIPKDRSYSSDDEWVQKNGDRVRIGVSDYAQQQLGDIVFIELPELGATLSRGDAFGVIESVKAVSDLLAPISGTVSEINDALADAPERVNDDCYGEGWILAVTPSDPSEIDDLMDSDAYLAAIASRESDSDNDSRED